MLSGKRCVPEVCHKWDISTTHAYKLKDQVLELLRADAGKPAMKTPAKYYEPLTINYQLYLSSRISIALNFFPSRNSSDASSLV
jgi:hypothetical protein